MLEALRRQELYVSDRAVTPEPPAYANFHSSFTVHVVFTTWGGTRAALRSAAQWACSLQAHIVVWFPQAVPRQFPIRKPPVSTDFTERCLCAMAKLCCEDADVRIQMCLCTNPQECLSSVFDAESIVLMGGRKRWWRTREERLAGFLQSCGRRVLFIPTEESDAATLVALHQVAV